MWYREAKMTPEDKHIDQEIKRLIRTSPFFAHQFKYYGIDPKSLWQVDFHTGDLIDDLCFVEGDDITIDRSLVRRSLPEALPFIAHELSHWMQKQREKDHYFSDPEEVKGFEWSIAFELQRGATMDEIERKLMPILQREYPDPSEAHRVLLKLLIGARKLAD